MKIPKKLRKYCPYCRKHTEHTIKLLKASRKRGSLKAGQRRFERKLEGYGGFPKPTMSRKEGGYKGRYGSKTTKKVQILLTCTVCKRSHNMRGWRVKRAEVKKE